MMASQRRIFVHFQLNNGSSHENERHGRGGGSRVE